MNMQTTTHSKAESSTHLPLREVATPVIHLWLKNRGNPVEEDGDYRANFLTRLECAQIYELRDLMAADQVMDGIVVPEIKDAPAVQSLHLKTQAFLARYPQLLETGWTHPEGYVFELMKQTRAQREASNSCAVVKQ